MTHRYGYPPTKKNHNTPWESNTKSSLDRRPTRTDLRLDKQRSYTTYHRWIWYTHKDGMGCLSNSQTHPHALPRTDPRGIPSATQTTLIRCRGIDSLRFATHPTSTHIHFKEIYTKEISHLTRSPWSRPLWNLFLGSPRINPCVYTIAVPHIDLTHHPRSPEEIHLIQKKAR